MRSRRVLIATIFVVVCVWVGSYVYEPAHIATLLVRKPPSTNATSHVAPRPHHLADFVSNLADDFNYVWRLLTSDKELVLYAAAAVFGLFMMVLAVNSATPVDKHKTDALLEHLKEEKEKAENLARLKSEFLNQVSHELRTPLAVIIGYLECLTDGLYGQVDSKHQDILQIVAKQSGHLKNMIDQILIYSRLEASKQPLRIEEFSPVKVLVDSRDTFDFLCQQKGIQLNWELPRSGPAMKNDAERFKEIASNLLQNAVKYTDQGSITVSIYESQTSDSVVLQVCDTGVGIPPNALNSVFEPFIQVHRTSTENSRGGIGLGLSIVKKHIEQMSGTITVESELGKGSKFTVSFPRLYRNTKKRRYGLWRKFKFPFWLEKDSNASVQVSLRRKRTEETTRAPGMI